MLESTLSEFAECLVIPAVVSDFVSLGECSLDDLGMFLNKLTEDEEGRLDVALLEDVEEARGEHGARSVIKGHRNHGLVNADRGDIRVVFPLFRQLLRCLHRHRSGSLCRVGLRWLSGCGRCGSVGIGLRQNGCGGAEDHCQQHRGEEARDRKATEHGFFNVTDFGKVARAGFSSQRSPGDDPESPAYPALSILGNQGLGTR